MKDLQTAKIQILDKRYKIKDFFIIFAEQIKVKMEYSIIIEKNPETGWYCGQCKQLPEALSQGQTLDELMKNMKEAIELAIECRL